MEEEISLLNQYQEYHTNNASGITEESLLKQSRDFLTTVKPEYRFVHLNVDFYRNVLGIIAQKYDRNVESIQKINTGFNSLEKYAVNLWKFPWRKEYRTIKVCTGYVECIKLITKSSLIFIVIVIQKLVLISRVTICRSVFYNHCVSYGRIN